MSACLILVDDGFEPGIGYHWGDLTLAFADVAAQPGRIDLAQVRARLRHDGQRRRHVHAVYPREVYTAHLEQPRAQVELRRVAGRAALLALGGLVQGQLDGLARVRDDRRAQGRERRGDVPYASSDHDNDKVDRLGQSDVASS